jgi:hypothetical protein
MTGWGRGFESLRPLQSFNNFPDVGPSERAASRHTASSNDGVDGDWLTVADAKSSTWPCATFDHAAIHGDQEANKNKPPAGRPFWNASLCGYSTSRPGSNWRSFAASTRLPTLLLKEPAAPSIVARQKSAPFTVSPRPLSPSRCCRAGPTTVTYESGSVTESPFERTAQARREEPRAG